MENAINSAIAECSGGCETFFWITDMHWEPALNTRKSPLLIKYIASKTGVNKILNGGDTGNSQVICENAIAHHPSLCPTLFYTFLSACHYNMFKLKQKKSAPSSLVYSLSSRRQTSLHYIHKERVRHTAYP